MSFRRKMMSLSLAAAVMLGSLVSNVPTAKAADVNDIEKNGLENEAEGYIKVDSSTGKYGYIGMERVGVEGDLSTASVETASVQSAYMNSISQLAAFPATRDQSPYNTCWSFSANAMAEFSLVKKGLANNTIDLSELHTAYFAYNPSLDILGGTTGDNNGIVSEKSYLDFGGNDMIASRTLSAWKGVASEAQFPYSAAAGWAAGAVDGSYAQNYDVAKLKNAYTFNINPTKGTLDVAKSFIMANGAIGIGYYADLTTATYNANVEYINEKYSGSEKTKYLEKLKMFECEKDNVPYNGELVSTYYVPQLTASALSAVSDHAVTIVGWDDNFPASNFAQAAPANGAWLVRNSWSTTVSNSIDSYFWLSYYDATIDSDAWSLEMTAATDYDHNYQYDGGIYAFPYQIQGLSSVGNVFTAATDELVTAVMVSNLWYLTDTFTIKVYNNLKNPQDPTSGTLASTKVFVAPCSGQFTVDLDTPVVAEKGSNFAVVITTASGSYDLESDFNTQRKSGIYTSDVTASGHSFLCYSGVWFQSGVCKSTTGASQCGNTSMYMFGDFSIKALTKSGVPMKLSSGSKGIDISWDAMAGASAYSVYRTVDGAVSLIATVAGNSYTDTAVKGGKTYAYYVVGNNGASTLQKSISCLAAPAWKSLKSQKTKTLTVKFKKNSSASGYEIQYSTKKSFKGAKTIKLSKNTKVSKTITGLKKGKKYYVRIRAYKGNAYSSWSKTKSAKVK